MMRHPPVRVLSLPFVDDVPTRHSLPQANGDLLDELRRVFSPVEVRIGETIHLLTK